MPSDLSLSDITPPKPPKGAETPRITITGGSADAVSPILEDGDELGYKEPDDLTDDDERWLIRGWGLNPERWEIIDGTLSVNRWQGMTNKVRDNELVWQHQYKARLKRRAGAPASPAAMADLIKLLRGKPQVRPATFPDGTPDRWLVVVLTDLQAGKGEGGGSPSLARRLRHQAGVLRKKLQEAKKAGTPFTGVVILGGGDLVEQCAGHYAMQTFQADLDRRSQERFVRESIRLFVDAVIDLVSEVLLMAVPGNHGENRNENGKAYTTWTDNSDLAVFEQVFEALKENPGRYGHVRLELPAEGDIPGQVTDPLVMVREIAGVNLGAHHGHAIRKSGHTIQKIEAWWATQALGNRPVAKADILVVGHLHHFLMSEATGRTILQAPANDGGSYWWTVSSGQSSPAGLLTFGIGQVYGPRKWGDLDIIDGPSA